MKIVWILFVSGFQHHAKPAWDNDSIWSVSSLILLHVDRYANAFRVSLHVCIIKC